MTNPRKYDGVFGLCYVWAATHLLKLMNIANGWYTGHSILQALCRDIQAIEYPMSEKTVKTSSRNDVGLLRRHGALLFRMEVVLAYTESCRREMYAILLDDDADVPRLSRIIFYKSFYAANRNHGQLEVDLMGECLNTIHAAHVSTRHVLARCDEQVNWSDHGETLRSIAINLGMNHSIQKSGPDKCWQSIGFQGDDPCTDFRSTGQLGLHHLEYFSERHPLYALHMIEESGTTAALEVDVACYPFALCSIHVTKFLCDLLQSGSLQRHLLQAELAGTSGIGEFTDALFSFLFVRCHLDWAQGVDKGEITSILQFEAFFKEYRQYIESELSSKVWENADFHPQRTWW